MMKGYIFRAGFFVDKLTFLIYIFPGATDYGIGNGLLGADLKSNPITRHDRFPEFGPINAGQKTLPDADLGVAALGDEAVGAGNEVRRLSYNFV